MSAQYDEATAEHRKAVVRDWIESIHGTATLSQAPGTAPNAPMGGQI